MSKKYDYMTKRLANDDELYSGFKTERAKLALEEARAELAECATASRYVEELRMSLADHIRNLRLLADSNKRDKTRIAELEAAVERLRQYDTEQ